VTGLAITNLVQAAGIQSYVQQPRTPPFGSLNSRGSILALFALTTGIRERRIAARAGWTEVRSYACMRLETFGERVCLT
jgi:hypothetical protein